MKRKTHQTAWLVVATVVLAIFVQTTHADVATLSTAFTYQGQLKYDGTPVDGDADFVFHLFDQEAAGIEIGTYVEAYAVDVVDGLFTVDLDFGAEVFTGDPRWLDIEVRYPATTGVWTQLSPRQLVTATPYALQTRGMFCDDAGRVGIGTISPAADLHVSGGVGSVSVLVEADTNNSGESDQPSLTFTQDGGLVSASLGYFDTTNDFSISLASTTPTNLLLRTPGNVGIGTINPAQKLHVSGGDARFDGDIVLHYASGNASIRLRPYQALGVAGEVSLLRDDGVETVEILAAEGFAAGGQITLRTATNTETIQIDGEYGNNGGGYIEVTGGTEEPAIYALGSGSGKYDATLRVNNTQANQGMAAHLTNDSDFATMHVENDGTGQTLWLVNGGGGDIIVARDATRSVFWVDGEGTTHTQGGASVPALQAEGTSDVSPTGGGVVVIGSPAGNNVALDGNEIMARNNDGTSTLYINRDGGDVVCGGTLDIGLERVVGSPGDPHVNCPSGKKVIGGGCSCMIGAHEAVRASFPDSDLTGWNCICEGDDIERIYVICADVK